MNLNSDKVFNRYRRPESFPDNFNWTDPDEDLERLDHRKSCNTTARKKSTLISSQSFSNRPDLFSSIG